MKRREFLKTAGVGAAGLGVAGLGLSGSIHAGARRPNILFIFADDLGYETLGCYGGMGDLTPRLDALAAEGTRFARAYTSPVCTPSRMSTYTGTYTPRHGYTTVLPVHKGTRQAVDFRRRFRTYAHVLRAAGYQTSVTGKWQLATLEHHPDHCRSAGFDSWCVWQIWRDGKKTTRYWNPTLNRDGRVLEEARSRFGPDVLTEYVVARMRAAKKAGRPFCIHHNMMLPHVPRVQTPVDKKRGRAASLANMLTYLDGQVGRLLDALDELGIAKDTFVVFAGDNGTEGRIPNRHGTVVGGKRSLTDGGIHIPLIARCPGRVRSGVVAEDLVDSADFFPTFCEVAGVRVPAGAAPDGVSFAQVLSGAGAGARKWVTGGIQGNFVVFDGRWRLDHKKRGLTDCRELPRERAADMKTPEAREAMARLGPVVTRLATLQM